MRTSLFRRLAALALAAAAAAATGSCRQSPEGIVNVVVIGGDPRLVEPQDRALTAAESVLVANAAQGLVRFDARGQIVPGLAETWNVSDDGLSYIFRLANAEWPDGGKITAEQVARMLRRSIAPSSRNPLSDAFGEIDAVVAMTDRVIEIRLSQPRPHLLQLLAQPAMGLVNNGQGTGPLSIDRRASTDGVIRLTREIAVPDEEPSVTERLNLSGAKPKDAIAGFVAGKVDLVLGGRFADLPGVPRSRLPRRSLQFDPAMGLFGLVPARRGGPAADAELRRVLSEAIDRSALVAALDVPGLVPRTTVLEPGLDFLPDPVAPAWAGTSAADRREDLAVRASRLFMSGEPPVIRLALPDGPGSDIVLNRLQQDWAVLGIEVRRAAKGERADFRLIDEVAPSTSPSWYLRHFRCAVAPVCDSEIDELLEGARHATVQDQRSALFQEASKQIDELELFIPIAAPIRWSLVSARITGFAPNRFAIHTLTGLEQRLNRTDQ